MIIYKFEDIMKTKGISWYRLLKENIISKPTKDNFKKGGDLSMQKLGELCNFLDCSLSDIVEYAKDDSFEANSYILKKAIEERKFDEEFESLYEKVCYRGSNYIYYLVEMYKDSIDSRQQEKITSWMYDIIEVERILKDFDKIVKYAEAHATQTIERFEALESMEALFIEIEQERIDGILCDGSLSRLCNLREEFSWNEYLDEYLNIWRDEHNEQDDETGEIIGTNYYDITNDEIIVKLSDKEYCELIETLQYTFGYKEDIFFNLVEEFVNED